MSNFDFDELDKAVADALGSNASSVSFNDAAGDLVSQDNASTDALEVASEAPKEEKAAPAVAAQKPVPPPAARRSSGRFMDVVHPSSDMRTASASRAAFTPPAPRPTPPAEVEQATGAKDDFENISDLGWEKPIESPFLPDAKVEKRPLGAEVPTGPTATNALPEEEALLLEAPDDPLLEATTMPDPIDFAAQSNVLAAETEDTGVFDATVLEEPEAPEISKTPEIAETPEVAAPSTPAPVTSTPEPAGPASITQQYEEKPSSQQESGAIYDTENYHRPVTEAAGKSHGAWTIIWIILLVLLGAGAGVAFYFFVLPML